MRVGGWGGWLGVTEVMGTRKRLVVAYIALNFSRAAVVSSGGYPTLLYYGHLPALSALLKPPLLLPHTPWIFPHTGNLHPSTRSLSSSHATRFCRSFRPFHLQSESSSLSVAFVFVYLLFTRVCHGVSPYPHHVSECTIHPFYHPLHTTISPARRQ